MQVSDRSKSYQTQFLTIPPRLVSLSVEALAIFDRGRMTENFWSITSSKKIWRTENLGGNDSVLGKASLYTSIHPSISHGLTPGPRYISGFLPASQCQKQLVRKKFNLCIPQEIQEGDVLTTPLMLDPNQLLVQLNENSTKKTIKEHYFFKIHSDPSVLNIP